MEASYVGNRTVWLGGFLGYLDSSGHTPWSRACRTWHLSSCGNGSGGVQFCAVRRLVYGGRRLRTRNPEPGDQHYGGDPDPGQGGSDEYRSL